MSDAENGQCAKQSEAEAAEDIKYCAAVRRRRARGEPLRESQCVGEERGDTETERGNVILAVQPAQSEQSGTE